MIVRLVVLLLVFAAGGVAGMLWARAQLDAPAATGATGSPAVATSAADKRAVVEVLVRRGALDRRYSGIALLEHNLVLAALPGFSGADSIRWRDGDAWQTVERSYLLAPGYSLVAFPARLDGHGLVLAAPANGLAVGRQVLAALFDERIATYVNSPVLRRDDATWFELGARLPSGYAGAALLAPGSGELVGIGVLHNADTAEQRIVAVDTEVLLQWLDNPGDALTPAQLAARLADSAPGLKQRIKLALAAGAYGDALELAALFASRWPQRQDQLRSSLVTAMRSLADAPQLPSLNIPPERLLAPWLPDDELLLEAARYHAGRGSPAAALAALQRRARLLGSAVLGAPFNELLRSLLIASADDQQVPSADSIELVQEALARDEYAGYHAALGRLFFELSRYAEAAFHLQRARQLDPALAADVAELLATAEQRRGNPALIEVPLTSRGGVLFVDAVFNGRPPALRLLVDTGATYTALTRNALAQLGLAGDIGRGGRVVQLQTASGVIDAPLITLGSLAVGQARVSSVPVVVLDSLGDADGLLGLSFLRHYSVDLDQAGGKLLLAPR